jgi:uncharacterized protein YkwD
MYKFICVMLLATVALAACRPAPQPTPTIPPNPTAVAAPTSTATPPPTATAVPTTAPTTAPTVVPTATPAATPTTQPTTAPTLQVQVNSPDVGYLNVRDAPSTSGVLVEQVKDRAVLDVLGAADAARAQVGQQGQWLKVRTPDGKEGFVSAWYLSLPGVSPAPQPTAVSAPPDLSGVALDLFNRTNALRAQNGLTPYRNLPMLNAAAQRHSQDMASTGNISHAGSDGSTVQQRVLDTGYGNWPVAENIFGGAATMDDAWNDWTNDPAHRAELLSPQFRDVGVSVAKGKSDTYYYTMVFGARPAQAPEPTVTPMPTPVSVVSIPPTATPNPALDSALVLFNRTNALRAQNGLPPYKLSDKLNASAQRHSQDMANTGNIDHSGSDGSTVRQRILDTGYEAQFTGENIYGGMATVDDAWNYWANDPPHRDILLNKLFTDIGISVVKGPRGTLYYTMDLARPIAP